MRVGGVHKCGEELVEADAVLVPRRIYCQTLVRSEDEFTRLE